MNLCDSNIADQTSRFVPICPQHLYNSD